MGKTPAMRPFRRLVAVGLAAACAVPAMGSSSSGVPATADEMPIQHVLVLMQENRSFDSYLGRLHFQGQRRSTLLSLSRHNPNPVKKGRKIFVFHKKRLCEVADLDHSWNGSHIEYDHGKMNGFTTANVN